VRLGRQRSPAMPCQPRRLDAAPRIDAAKPLHVTATGTAVGALKALTKIPSAHAKADMTENLERLDSLHKSGALDDFEYAKAKDCVIRGETG
jgi:hypothetical protein